MVTEKEQEVVDKGRRYKISRRNGNFYLFVSFTGMSITAPIENNPKTAERRSALEAMMLLATICLEKGVPLREIGDIISRVDVVCKTVMTDIGESILHFCDTSKGKIL